VVRDGEVAPAGREALRRAVLARDRARSERGRADVDESLAAWGALVEGRWSLVDVFERGGKRWVVAVPNLPEVRDPRALPPVERAVFALLTRGRSNKSIAFELGIAEGTVAGHVREIRRKLGVEALRAAASARASYTSRFALGAADLVAIVSDSVGARLGAGALSAAEEMVVGLVLSGCSNEDIAQRRGTSQRTVANQLASAYRKLGVGSRRELRAASIAESDPWK
jgi:DNA-binding NarL/FixJ family response regulator